MRSPRKLLEVSRHVPRARSHVASLSIFHVGGDPGDLFFPRSRKRKRTLVISIFILYEIAWAQDDPALFDTSQTLLRLSARRLLISSWFLSLRCLSSRTRVNFYHAITEMLDTALSRCRYLEWRQLTNFDSETVISEGRNSRCHRCSIEQRPFFPKNGRMLPRIGRRASVGRSAYVRAVVPPTPYPPLSLSLFHCAVCTDAPGLFEQMRTRRRRYVALEIFASPSRNGTCAIPRGPSRVGRARIPVAGWFFL